MKNIIGLAFLILTYFTSCSVSSLEQGSDANTAKDQVISELFKQQESWNDGDINGFMKGYWNHDSLMFVSGDRISYGWQKVTDNYNRKYSSKELMGELIFKVDKAEVLANDAVVIIGQWDLKNEVSQFGGKFSLLWRKINGEWKIVIDHTS